MKMLPLFVLLLSVPLTALGDGPAPEFNVRQAVETYIKIELDLGNPDMRKKIIKFSPKRESEFNAQEPGEWIFSAFGSFDRIVVSSCEPVTIKVMNSQAEAKVSCHRLARSEGRGDSGTNPWHLVRESPQDETLLLTLVFEKGQWWVLDPPAPRVSKDSMVRYYTSQLKWYEEQLKTTGHLPEHQQVAFDRKSATLQLLKQLETPLQ